MWFLFLLLFRIRDAIESSSASVTTLALLLFVDLDLEPVCDISTRFLSLYLSCSLSLRVFVSLLVPRILGGEDSCSREI